MKSKRPPKPSKQDKVWQRKIEKKVKIEGLKLDHPSGKEQFEHAIENSLKKKSR